MKNFLIVRNFLNKDTCLSMADKLDSLHKQGLSLPPDNQCIRSPAFYGVFNDESLTFLPKIENLICKELFPTYTYSRIYQYGEILLPHTDRESCEISFTLTLKYDREIWPFYIESNGDAHEVSLDIGDILIYKGMIDSHWRLPLKSNFQYQAFFHYVDKTGPYTNHKYDKRHNFASTQESLDELKRKINVLQ